MTGSPDPIVGGPKRPAKSCGHERHVGTCPHCQRTQLARWNTQLRESTRGAMPIVAAHPADAIVRAA